MTDTFAMGAPPPPYAARLLTAEAILGVVVGALPALLVAVGAQHGRAVRVPLGALALALVPLARGAVALRRARDVIERVAVTGERCAVRVRRRGGVVERELALRSMTATWRRIPREAGALVCLTLAAPGGFLVRQYSRAGVWDAPALRALYEHLAPRVGRAAERVGEGWFAP